MNGLFTRRKRSDSAATAAADPQTGTAAVADQPSESELLDQIRRLTEHRRSVGDPDDERELLRLRNQAGIRRLQAANGGVSFAKPSATLPGGGDLPEFSRDQLTPELLRAAILRDGCMLVRGLIGRDDAEQVAELIDRAFAERDRHDAGEPHDSSLYDEFVPDPRYGQELARAWIKEGGGVLAVDSPRLSFMLGELLADAGMPRLVNGYLGEPALTTAQKTTLRKAEPSIPGGWHQDGKFMGPVRSLNLWLSLSRCGDEAPSLDIIPRRIDEFITTQTDEAMLDYMISQRIAEDAAGETGILRPIFEPGDALLFDDMFVHKTGSDPDMPKPRYALEHWFFGASGFPREYAPLTV